MCQHLKCLYNSENQYFPSELCVTFEKYSWVKKKKKNPFNVQDSQADSSITEDKKFISSFRFHNVLTFKKPSLALYGKARELEHPK